MHLALISGCGTPSLCELGFVVKVSLMIFNNNMVFQDVGLLKEFCKLTKNLA